MAGFRERLGGAAEAYEELNLEYVPGYGTAGVTTVEANVIASDLVFAHPGGLPGTPTDCGDFDIALNDDGSVDSETLDCRAVPGAGDTYLAFDEMGQAWAASIPGSIYEGSYCAAPVIPNYKCVGFISNPALGGWRIVVLTADSSVSTESSTPAAFRYDGQWAIVSISSFSPATWRDTLEYGTVTRNEDGNLEWEGTIDLDP